MSFSSTPSPSGQLVALQEARRRRAATMSTTSSVSRRPFGNPAVSPPSTPKRFRAGRGRHAEVDLQRVGRRRVRARSAVRPGMPGQQRLHDVRAVRLRDVEAREQDVDDLRQLRRDDVLAVELRVVGSAACALKRSFLPERDDDLVDERVAQAADLDVAVVAGRLAVPSCASSARGDAALHLQPRALGRGPDADDGVAGASGRLTALPSTVTSDFGHLQDDRVDVVARQVVLAATGVAGAVADVDRVERRAEVDEERIVDLAGEHLAAAAQRLDRLRRRPPS